MGDKIKDPRQCVFAVVMMADGTPMLTIGIPEAAWEHMRLGNTSEFDMRKIGLPVAVTLFGGKDQDELMAMLSQGAAAAGVDLVHDLGRDYSIPKPRSH